MKPLSKKKQEALDRKDDGLISVDISSNSLESELSRKYTDIFIKTLQRLAYEISVVGLPIPEACVYVGVEYERLRVLMEQDPLIERLIQTKDIEYKRNLMITVSEKAKTDDKVSQWLLQSRYPDEFNPKKGSTRQGNDQEDLIGIAMEFVRNSGDNVPLVTKKTLMIQQTTSEINNPEDKATKMKAILN